MRNFSKNELRIHLICWMVYIFVEVVLAGFIAGKFNSFFLYVLFYPINIGVFYLHALWAMPLLNRKHKNRFLLFFLAVILECILYLAAATLANLLLNTIGLRETPLVVDLKYICITIWRGSFFIMYASGYFYLNRHLEQKDLEMLRALEIERLRYQLVIAEKDFLRAQINPHLLFNTLNFIKHSTKHNGDNAALAISSLTDLMEYALEDSKNDYVALTKEIEQMENLIKLNRLRFEHLLNLSYTKDISNSKAEILPIILLTLVENLFKHGILNDPDNPANIEIRADEREIFFRTSNLAAANGKTTGGQTGLKNISARLEHAYPNSYDFAYETKGNRFETRLTINLNNQSGT
ncbi:histidine kinase [Pedobacter sp. SG908]|uniref:sensor histidine kinase n=1 Tax=Pedobacter sp. SG908 TaxID=2587135 RepID=UPI0014243370|nr:histidine kinase [Pedobacter sp. SG908]NII83184.1 sensor histidine kinase YesM [Pedobacter sp. SG908]